MTHVEPTEPPPGLRTLLVLPLYVPAIVLAFARGMLAPIIPLYIVADFGGSYATVGAVMAAQGIGSLIADVPAGMIAGRIGHKRAMIGGVALFSLTTAGMAISRTIPELVAYFVAAGFGNALWNVSRHTYVADLIPKEYRGRSLSVLGGIMRFGRIGGPVLGGILALRFGYRVGLGTAAVLGSASALIILVYAVDRVPAVVRGGLFQHIGYLAAVFGRHQRILLIAGTGQIFAQTIRSARGIILPLFAAEALGLDAEHVGYILGITSTFDTLMFYPAGLLMDHFGRKSAIVPCFLIQAGGMALVPFAGGFASLAAIGALIGFGNGLGSGSMMTLGADLAPDDSRSEFLGLWRLIGDSGGVLGPWGVGEAAETFGLPKAPFAIALAGLAAAAILGFLVPETHVPRHRTRPREPVIPPTQVP